MKTEKYPDKANVIIFPPLLFLSTLATGLLLSFFFPYHFLPWPPALFCGVMFAVIGFALLVYTARTMNSHKTTINPRGITTTIISIGIFKYSRNPMYISFGLIYTGIAIITNAWLGILLLIPLFIIVQKGIVEREEKYLTQKFGQDYLTYKARVRRWF